MFVLPNIKNGISIVWRNWIRLKLIFSRYLPVDRYVFSRRSWKYHSARQGRLDWTCFTSLVKFYLVSRKAFLLYSILTFHKVFLFFTLQIIEVHTSYCLYCIILCCWIKHSTWHCRVHVTIQFEYCFPIIGQCIIFKIRTPHFFLQQHCPTSNMWEAIFYSRVEYSCNDYHFTKRRGSGPQN